MRKLRFVLLRRQRNLRIGAAKKKKKKKELEPLFVGRAVDSIGACGSFHGRSNGSMHYSSGSDGMKGIVNLNGGRLDILSRR